MGEKIKVDRFVTPEQLREDTSFTEAGLNEAIMEQASLMAHYGVLAADAQFQVDKFKQLLEIEEAKLARDIRDEADFDGKKLTEKQLEQKLALHPSIIRHKNAVNEAKQVYEVLRIAIEAMKQRKDMVIQVGVRHRIELETQGRIMGSEEARKRADVAGKERIAETMSKVAQK